MADIVDILSPVRSEQLMLMGNPPNPPGPVYRTDLNNQAQLRTLIQQAEDYTAELKYLKRKRATENSVTMEDTTHSESFRMKLEIACQIPLSIANIPAVQQEGNVLAAIAQLSTQMNNRFAVVENRLAVVENRLAVVEMRSFNSSAHELADEVIPPQHGLNPPPNTFPTTIGAISTLECGQLLTQIENYYGLGHTGGLIIRKNRIRRKYGFGIVTKLGEAINSIVSL